MKGIYRVADFTQHKTDLLYVTALLFILSLVTYAIRCILVYFVFLTSMKVSGFQEFMSA